MLVVKTILAAIVPTSNRVMIKPATANSKTVLASKQKGYTLSTIIQQVQGESYLSHGTKYQY